jgi:hypothetical protein
MEAEDDMEIFDHTIPIKCKKCDANAYEYCLLQSI